MNFISHPPVDSQIAKKKVFSKYKIVLTSGQNKKAELHFQFIFKKVSDCKYVFI